MLLKCNSEGCSTCVGDSGQSYKNSKALLFSLEKHALPEIYICTRLFPQKVGWHIMLKMKSVEGGKRKVSMKLTVQDPISIVFF